MHNNLFATVLSEIRSPATAEDDVFACASAIICAQNIIIYSYYNNNNMCLSNNRIRHRWYRCTMIYDNIVAAVWGKSAVADVIC